MARSFPQYSNDKPISRWAFNEGKGRSAEEIAEYINEGWFQKVSANEKLAAKGEAWNQRALTFHLYEISRKEYGYTSGIPTLGETISIQQGNWKLSEKQVGVIARDLAERLTGKRREQL